LARNKRLAIVDADTVLYQVALSAEMCARGQGMNGEDMWFGVRGVEDCYQDVLNRLDQKISDVDAKDGIICLSHSRCFRYDVLPSYKANRARTRRPPMMVNLRAQLLDRQPFKMIRVVDRLEADDLCGIASTSIQQGGTGLEPIIISEDKDLLTIPGILYQKGRSFEVTLEEADRAHMYQTLVGDTTDGYKGLPGVGPKKADKILDAAEGTAVKYLWEAAHAAFIGGGWTHEYALTQARVARILRCEDWDQHTKEIRLWEVPQ
jgi:DNA polymerase-1